jgi:hypothetical protein
LAGGAEVKGKGRMRTFWVEPAAAAANASHSFAAPRLVPGAGFALEASRWGFVRWHSLPTMDAGGS